MDAQEQQLEDQDCERECIGAHGSVDMTERARRWTLTGSFAFSVQALFFAPHVAPFLYFQF